jgi:hypothetical protein
MTREGEELLPILAQDSYARETLVDIDSSGIRQYFQSLLRYALVITILGLIGIFDTEAVVSVVIHPRPFGQVPGAPAASLSSLFLII